MIRRPPRSTLDRSSAASDVYKRQHKIRANKKHGLNDPVITVKNGRTNTYCHEVEILGPSTVIYSGNETTLLACGARVAVVTESPVKIVR